MPTIQTQPQSARTNRHNGALLGFGTGNGLTYQCVAAAPTTEGRQTSGRGSDTLVLKQCGSADAAPYAVVITNAAGSITSSVASLTVIFAFPLRTVQLHSRFSLSNQISPDFLA